ncbi:MAG: methylated-DNA--[protein]-cysteine S-methyltransferase [Solibacillus sp.]|uniref:methylated-DNA--[protein]-cysteine S-methyltransferase n=1 Tax=unclassified Solibacillus TaxID=2637870 RepID=UPI0030F7FB9F
MYTLDYVSPLGIIEIKGTEEGIFSVLFAKREQELYTKQANTPNVVLQCFEQLNEYFLGERLVFTVPFILEGTVFQKTVWQALTTVPYGKTASYKEIASFVGNEKAVRAVGTTNGKNLISIIVPCHRIIGANGKLTGYAGGLWRKEWLLAHEQKFRKKG